MGISVGCGVTWTWSIYLVTWKKEKIRVCTSQRNTTMKYSPIFSSPCLRPALMISSHLECQQLNWYFWSSMCLFIWSKINDDSNNELPRWNCFDKDVAIFGCSYFCLPSEFAGTCQQMVPEYVMATGKIVFLIGQNLFSIYEQRLR